MFIIHSEYKNSNGRVKKIRATVVGEHKEGLLTLAVARCSKSDNFCRKTGRELAEKRLREGKIYQKVNIKECDGKQFISIAKGILNEVENSGASEKYFENKKQRLEKAINKLKKELFSLEIENFPPSSASVLSVVKEPEESMHSQQKEEEESHTET